MTARCPDDTHVYVSLIHLLRKGGARYASALFDCRLTPAISFPTYVITAAGEVKARLASILEHILGREFDVRDDRWLLEVEEARAIAYGRGRTSATS
jgi:hypothetical protein